jgi:hypothetical protein
LTLRRWIVVVPILVATFAAIVFLMVNRSSEYSLRGSYLLMGAETQNPSDPPTDPSTAAEALQALLSRPSVLQELESANLSTDFSVIIGESGTSLRLAIDGATPQIVTQTAQRIATMANDLLAQTFQVDGAATVRARMLSEPQLSDATAVADGYRINSTIVVTSESPNSGNPFGANLGTVGTLIALGTSNDFADLVEASVPGLTYTITNQNRDAPMLEISVKAETEELSTTGYAFVRDELAAGLQRLQDQSQVNPAYRTQLRSVVEPSTPQSSPSSVVRPVAGLMILGTGLAIAIATLVEAIANGMRLARGQQPAGSPDDRRRPDETHAHIAKTDGAKVSPADETTPSDEDDATWEKYFAGDEDEADRSADPAPVVGSVSRRQRRRVSKTA